jgi:hypothetical protein
MALVLMSMPTGEEDEPRLNRSLDVMVSNVSWGILEDLIERKARCNGRGKTKARGKGYLRCLEGIALIQKER